MTAQEIFETFNSLEKANENPEYYEINNLITMFDDDGAVQLIQKCFNCDEKTAKEAIDLSRNEFDEMVRARGGFQRQKNNIGRG